MPSHQLFRRIVRCLVPAYALVAAIPGLAAEVSKSRPMDQAPLGIAAEQLGSVKQLKVENTTPGQDNAPTLRLVGSDARSQLLVTGALEVGGKLLEVDATRQVTYTATPAGILDISSDGLMRPLADGVASLTVALPSGISTQVQVQSIGFNEHPPVNFPNQVIPVFTKYGCNGGGCHGKAAGQNGFKLSLLGFEPKEDFEHLVVESRGRRLFPASPDRSLLLTKAINEVPHGGGQRLEKDSHEYRLLSRWIAQGMPYGTDKDPVLTSITINPTQRLMKKNSSQQLTVIATYSMEPPKISRARFSMNRTIRKWPTSLRPDWCPAVTVLVT